MADGSPPLVAVLRFAAFVLLALVGPGLGFQRLLRLRADPALVLPTGLAFAAGAYWLSLVAHAPWLFPALALLAAAPLLVPAWRRPRAEGPSLRGALPSIGLLLLLLALTQFRTNRVDATGAFLLDEGEQVDTAVHAGLTWELVAGYPPQVPGLAGVPVRYHIATHLVRAAAARWAGLHPYDSLNRFDPALWGIALVLVLRAAAQALGLGRGALRLAGFLPLLSDLSFVPGLLFHSRFWAFKLGDSFLEAVFYANSIAPALALLLSAFVALTRREDEERRGALALALALAAAAAFFKVFVGLELLAALGCTWIFTRERRTIALLGAPLLISLALLAIGSLSSSGAGGVRADLRFFAPVNPARVAFALAPAEGAMFAVSALAWLVLSLGLRVIGIPAAWRALRSGEVPKALAGAAALIGWPIAAFLSISADPSFDESFYFMQASGLLLWLFAAPALAEAMTATPALAALGGLLCLPATAELVARKATQAPSRIPAAEVRAMTALREATRPGEVVLTHRLAHVPLVVVLAGRRVPFADYITYWPQFTTPEMLARRQSEVQAFFRATEPDAARAAAHVLDARYVYVSGPPLRDLEAMGILATVFAEGREHVYRITDAGPSAAVPVH